MHVHTIVFRTKGVASSPNLEKLFGDVRGYLEAQLVGLAKLAKPSQYV